jgi:predicted ArsR family transcriptional regulator
VLERIAFDSIPSPRREVLQHMLESEDASTLTAAVATALDLPTRSAERALEELNAHGLLGRSKSGAGETSPNLWQTSEQARARWVRIRELRRKPHGNSTSASPGMSGTPLLKDSHTPTYRDSG